MNYIYKLKRRINNNRIIKSIILITTGTAFSQVLNTILSPVITRLYTPQQYGVYTTYLSIISIITIAASLKLENAIPIADNDDTAVDLIFSSSILLVLVSFFIFLTVSLLPKTIMTLLGIQELYNYRFLLSVGTFFIGLYTILMQWNLRKKQFKLVSKTKIIQALSQNIIKIGLGVINFDAVGLIIGSIAGQSSGTLTIIKNESKLFYRRIKEFKFSTFTRLIKKYHKFPLYFAPSQILNTFGLQMPVLLLAYVYGDKYTGYYGLAHTIINLPMVFIGRSVGDVFYSEAASMKNDKPELRNILFKMMKKMFIFGLVPFTLLMLGSPVLFRVFFGQEWVKSGIYASILAPMIFIRFLLTPINSIFSIFERQREGLYIDIMRVAIVVCVFVTAQFLKLNDIYVIALYSLSTILIYVITAIMAKKILD